MWVLGVAQTLLLDVFITQFVVCANWTGKYLLKSVIRPALDNIPKWDSFLKCVVPDAQRRFMMQMIWVLLSGCFVSLASAAYDVVVPTATHNLTDYLHTRQKRHQLIYRNGGTIRLVVGPVMATQLEDPVTWRGLVYFWTLHFGGYTLPSAPLYPWDKWETIYARSLQEQVRRLDASHEDDTRLFVYEILEKYMDQASGSVGLGHQCLLRGICENAQIHRHVGIMAELLNILLTPGKARLDLSYTEAHAAGLAGSHCFEQFSECPRGKSVLDAFAVDVED